MRESGPIRRLSGSLRSPSARRSAGLSAGSSAAMVAVLVTGLSALIPAHAGARTPLTERPVAQTRIGSNVACLIEAVRTGDGAEYTRCAHNGLAAFDGGRLELQVHVADGYTPSALDQTIDDAGGRIEVRGIDLLNAWLPLSAVEAFARHPAVAFVQMPQRPVTWTGKVAGQGGKILRTAKVACTGAMGSGQTVAVVDSGFSDLDKSLKNKEVYKLVGDTKFEGGAHGTMCAEAVAEVAPRAIIYPVRTPSLAWMQKFINELVGENPHNVSIVSHSVGWMGMSFGRHTGPLCSLTDKARHAGVAWVNASGNNGGGNFYTAAFTDADGDGNHDVLPGEPKLMFKAGHNATFQIYFDWDDYEKTTIDLDLFLFREDKGFFKLVGKSAKNHTGYTGASEFIYMPKMPAGVYALVMARSKSGPKPGNVRLRVLNKSTKTSTLSVHHKNNNVYDPASCKGVLAVGALRHGLYEKGPLENYSSYGPTVDGRQKPEVVAPTGVSTSKGWFFGTSAACPHAAGALALYAASTPATALELVGQLIDDADPFGVEDPDEAYGHGRVRVNAEFLGWQCDREALTMPTPCTSTCGTVGKRGCGAKCRWNKCVPPWETCNGVDDDCDGFTDEEPICQGGPDTTEDAGQDDADQAATDGAVAGLDGAQDGQDTPDTGSKGDGKPDSGGCQATPTGGAGAPWWLLLCLLSAPAVLRMKRSAVCRCPPSSSRRCRST